VLGLRTLPDARPGRTETIELWPFSQGEIDGTPDRFVDTVFAQGPELRHTSEVSQAEYAERVVRGGFPEAVARTQPRRRVRFFDAYVNDLVSRGVSRLSHYRTRDKVEVDAILENRRGEVVGIEVKAASTVRAEDFPRTATSRRAAG
jgi:predicted AAA+ superfamily ATPase